MRIELQMRTQAPSAGSSLVTPRREFGRAALLGALWFVASYLGLVLSWDEHNYAPLRIGGALALGLALRWKPRDPWPFLVAGFVAVAAANLLAGRAPGVVWPIALARVFEIGLAYGLLRAWRIDPIGLPSASVLARTLVVAAVIAPLPSALLAGWLGERQLGASFGAAVYNWAVGNAYGLVVVLPAMLAYRPGAWGRLWQGRVRAGNLAVACLALGTAVGAPLLAARPFVVLTVPLLVAAFRLGRLGTSVISALSVGAVFAVKLLADSGLLASPPMQSLTLSQTALYSALSIVAPIVISIVIAERDRIEEELFQQKELAEVTLESIGDAVVTVDIDERVTYMNRIACDMTGWSLEEALGRNFHRIVCIQDAETSLPAPAPLERAMRDDKILGLQVNSALVRKDGYLSAIEDSASPIHDRSGEVIGGVMVFHDVSESRAMAIKMSHLAQHDYLTDLPNRVLLQDRLAQAILHAHRRGTSVGLLFIDLDHFKHINDSLGHHVGDRLLQQVAARLKDAVREDDTVSRQGGDEFVILLDRLNHQGDAARVAEKILQALSAPLEVEGHVLHASCSIGIALHPLDGEDPRELMKSADAAMYHAKQAGRRRYAFFTPAMNEQVTRRLTLENALRAAVAGNELRLHFQPKVASCGYAISGCEALVRWQHGGRLMAPDEFIPVAEECGLIADIDAWVMNAAAHQVRRWQLAGLPTVPVAVNVSVRRFDGEHFLAAVDEALASSGIAPHLLQIEVTESQMLADSERTHAIIAALHDRGVQIAIDDFGSGYASLSYLCGLRFDVLKIDRSFVAMLGGDPRQALVVDAILGIARALHFKVVAEGVETADQARILGQRGCDELQGYLFSRPVPPEKMAELLAAGRLEGLGSEPLAELARVAQET